MPKEEWGVKRACPKCSVRFYDLQNDPMTCPSCDAEFTLESLVEAAKSRGVVKAKAADPKAAEKPAGDDLEVVLDDDDDEVDSSISDELLDDDDEEDTSNLEEVSGVAKDDDDS